MRTLSALNKEERKNLGREWGGEAEGGNGSPLQASSCSERKRRGGREERGRETRRARAGQREPHGGETERLRATQRQRRSHRHPDTDGLMQKNRHTHKEGTGESKLKS